MNQRVVLPSYEVFCIFDNSLALLLLLRPTRSRSLRTGFQDTLACAAALGQTMRTSRQQACLEEPNRTPPGQSMLVCLHTTLLQDFACCTRPYWAIGGVCSAIATLGPYQESKEDAAFNRMYLGGSGVWVLPTAKTKAQQLHGHISCLRALPLFKCRGCNHRIKTGAGEQLMRWGKGGNGAFHSTSGVCPTIYQVNPWKIWRPKLAWVVDRDVCHRILTSTVRCESSVAAFAAVSSRRDVRAF